MFRDFVKKALIADPLKSRYLNRLEERSSGRKSVDVQKRRIKHPVPVGRSVNSFATFEGAVVVTRVEKIYQRSAVKQRITSPIFQKSFEIMDAAAHSRVVAALIGCCVQTGQRIAAYHCEAGKGL